MSFRLWLRDARGRFARRVRMASNKLRLAFTGGAVAVVVATGAVVDLANDPCYCVQALVTAQNRSQLAAAEVLGGAKDNEVIHFIACGEGEGPALPDTQVIGACGTRGVLSQGTGYAGKTATELKATGRWASDRVGISFRCSPDPDRPGYLNAESNEECCCPVEQTPACKNVVYVCRM